MESDKVEEEAGVAAPPGTPSNPDSCLDNNEFSNGFQEQVTSLEDDVNTEQEECLKEFTAVEKSDKMLATDIEGYSHPDSDHDSGCHDDSTSHIESSDVSMKESVCSDSRAPVIGSEWQAAGGCGDKESGDKRSEEEEIEEMMSRSDTLVIYPEPVTDHEDADESENKDVEGDGEHEENVEGEYLLKCPHCQKGFTRVYLLKEHITSQHANMVARHMCPECGVSFALKSHLDKHLSLHSPTAQICKICNKTFANVYRLSRHMISHEESSELRKFKCPECGKAFKFKHHLKEHCRIHSGEKPFECSNCGKRFSHSGSYSSHTTSKKCWVMNLKIKRNPAVQNNPLVPKADSHASDLTSLQAGLVAASTAPHNLIHPTHLHHAQFLNGARPTPFMSASHLPFQPGSGLLGNGGTLGGSQHVGAVPVQLQKALLEKTDVLHQLHSVAAQPPFTSTIHNVDTNHSLSPPTYVLSKLDENQNTKQDRASLSKDGENDKVADIKQEVNEVNDTSDSLVKEQSAMPAEVKKVLEIVGATVSQQQKSTDDKSQLSRLASPNASGRSLCDLAAAAEVISKIHTSDPDNRVMASVADSNQLACKFCKNKFESAIDLHQHERYMCDENTELRRSVQEGYTNISIKSPSRKSEDDNQSVSGDGDSRKCRARSLISEEQHQVLRAHFKTNPRPAKAELEMLARKISFPKRVVQVWFQNQRARIRRKGTVMPTPLLGDVEKMVSVATSVPYIPVVPQLTGRHTANSQSPLSSQMINTSSASMQVEPLDLSTSTRVQPQQAHVNKPFSSCPLTGMSSEDGEVLNLSKKSSQHSSDSESELDSRQGTPSNTATYDNMSVTSTPSPSLTPPPVCMVNTTTAHNSLNHNVTQATNGHYDRLMTSTPHMGSPVLLHPVSPIPNITSPAQASTFNSAPIETMIGFHGDMATSDKPLKRARKKSWRQMEADAFQMEYDNAIDEEDDDEDGQLPRKRRSWKQHKVDAGEGMYACDQCDKMFNKQSSLARHKYEHSGQRPFPCDVCSKAFKHKHHLTEHKRLHSGEKPFTCKKCGKKFSHSGSFSQHMNHRYKYCKPVRLGVADNPDEASIQNDMSE